MKKDYPEKLNELEEAVLNYMRKIDPKFLKTEIPDKWKYLTKKLAYPYEYFNSINEHQKSVNNLKRENVFSKLKKTNVLVMKK